MRRRAAAAFGVCALAACTFGDLDADDHGSGPTPTPNEDASVVDAETNPNITDSSVIESDAEAGEAPADANADAATDANADAPADAGGDAGPCDPKSALFLGNDTDPTTAQTDQTGGGYMDCYGFVAASAGTVKCAFVYLDTASSAPVYVGVYSESDAGAPNALLATAQFNNSVQGWNGAPLDKTLAITSGEHVWLGVGAPVAVVNYRFHQGSCPGLDDYYDDVPATGPANPFNPIQNFPGACNVLAYLTQ